MVMTFTSTNSSDVPVTDRKCTNKSNSLPIQLAGSFYGRMVRAQQAAAATKKKKNNRSEGSDKLLRREFNLRRSLTGSHGEGMPKESDRKWDSAFYWAPPPPAAGLFHSSVSIPEGPDFSTVQLGRFSFFHCEFTSAA